MDYYAASKINNAYFQISWVTSLLLYKTDNIRRDRHDQQADTVNNNDVSNKTDRQMQIRLKKQMRSR